MINTVRCFFFISQETSSNIPAAGTRQVNTMGYYKHDQFSSQCEDKWTCSSTSTLGSVGSSQALVVQTENNNVPKFTVPQSLDNVSSQVRQ